MHEILKPLYDIINLVLPFSWAQPMFMKRALLTVCAITPLCSAIGILVVNFRMSFFSDAISHSAFTGIAIGVMFSVNPYLAMVVFGLIVGASIVFTRHKTNLAVDTVIGVFFCASVSFGVAVISYHKGLVRNLQSFLYGDILAVTDNELFWITILFFIVFGYLFISFNSLIYLGINDKLAKTKGINAKLNDYIFSLILALVITVSIRVVGILMVTGMLIVPPASARNVAKGVSSMFWLSIVFGVLSGLCGLIASYYLDTSTGASIVVCSSAIFFITHALRHFIR